MKILNYNDYQLNESFNSSKLRDIINQHGMPQYDMDKIFLHDLQDDEVIGVMDFDEWEDYHRENKNSYYIVLDDGSYLVLGNIDTFKEYVSDDDFRKEFKRRRDERHPGNELNDIPKHLRKDALENETTKHFREKVDELNHSRHIEEFKEKVGEEIHNLPGLVREYLETHFDENIPESIGDQGDSRATDQDTEFEMDFVNQTYVVGVNYNWYATDGYEKYGAVYCDVTVELNKIDIIGKFGENHDEDVIDIHELVDESELGNLFDDYKMEDVECKVTDYYDYYGVSPADFF
jgi:hypothetical protein